MLSLRIAMRSLLRQRRRSLFTGLAMLVGFVLSCFFIGWADGTYDYIIDSFTRNRLGHIQIHREGYLHKPSLYKTIDDPGTVERALSGIPRIDSWAPRLYSAGLASLGERSAGVSVIGIDPQREDRTTGFSAKVVQGRYFDGRSHQLLIGKDLARILKARPGDSVVFVSQAADGSIANDLYQLVGVVDAGDPALNRSGFYLSLDDAQQLFALQGRVHEVAVTVHDLRQVDGVVAALSERLRGQGLEVAGWKQFASEFYRAMQADKGGMYVTLLVVVIVVAITILNTVLMSVLERQREYGLLKAMGTRPSQIVKLVVAEVALLAGFCILAGSLIGWLLNLYFARHGILLAEPVVWGSVQMRYLKGEVNLRSFLLPAATVLLTSLAVCLPPAFRAARTDPARTMRTF
jgi:putative ABC transport system permease protein